MGATAFDPDLSGVARWLPRAPFSKRTLPIMQSLSRLVGKRPPHHQAVERVGPTSVRLHGLISGAAPRPAMLWIHGGGFVIGSAAQDDALCAHVADELGVTVAAVDYRLAPAHRFPVPLEDCYRALVWLADQPTVDEARIAIGGASAGGGLAASLAMLARDRGEVQPAFQLLSYPMLDDRTATRVDIDERDFRLWNNKSNHLAWEAYTGAAPGSASIPTLAAPGRSSDLAGLPPAWIGVGALDLFLEEDQSYARRLADAGVPCELYVVDGAFHGFDSVRPKAGVTRSFRASQVAALARALT